MGVFDASIVQIALYACYSVYCLLGLACIILGAILTARIGVTSLAVGVLVVGCFMTLISLVAYYVTYIKHWFVLFLVELVNIFVIVVLFVASVQLVILGTGRTDPITDAVVESWDSGFRTDLESSGYCRTSSSTSCDDFYYHFYLRDDVSSDGTGEYYCPGIADDDQDFFASNCTKFLEIELCKERMYTECQRCDQQCRDLFIDDIKSYMVPVALVFWGLVTVLVVQIVWNNIIISTAEDPDNFSVDGVKAIVSHAINSIVFVFGFLVMILGIVSVGLISGACPDGESCIGWTSMGLVIFGALIFICSVVVSIAVWQGIVFLLKIMDDILIVLAFLLMLCGIPIAMTAGLLTSINDIYVQNYATIRTQLEAADVRYCSYPTECEKKHAQDLSCGVNNNEPCCKTCDAVWETATEDSDFFTGVVIDLNNRFNLMDESEVEENFDEDDYGWVEECYSDDVQLVCNKAVESLGTPCAYETVTFDSDDIKHTGFMSLVEEYAVEVENEENLIYECQYRQNSFDKHVFQHKDQYCEDATIEIEVDSNKKYTRKVQKTNANFEMNDGRKVCGNAAAENLYIVGGWENTASIPDGSNRMSGGRCLSYDILNDRCDYDSGNVGVWTADTPGVCWSEDVDFFDFDRKDDAGNAINWGCDLACQVLGGECEDRDTSKALNEMNGVEISSGSSGSNFDDWNTYRFTFTDGQVIDVWEKDGLAVLDSAESDLVKFYLGSLTQNECEANGRRWRSVKQLCEQKSWTNKFYNSTCARIGGCEPVCVGMPVISALAGISLVDASLPESNHYIVPTLQDLEDKVDEGLTSMFDQDAMDSCTNTGVCTSGEVDVFNSRVGCITDTESTIDNYDEDCDPLVYCVWESIPLSSNQFGNYIESVPECSAALYDADNRKNGYLDAKDCLRGSPQISLRGVVQSLGSGSVDGKCMNIIDGKGSCSNKYSWYNGEDSDECTGDDDCQRDKIHMVDNLNRGIVEGPDMSPSEVETYGWDWDAHRTFHSSIELKSDCVNFEKNDYNEWEDTSQGYKPIFELCGHDLSERHELNDEKTLDNYCKQFTLVDLDQPTQDEKECRAASIYGVLFCKWDMDESEPCQFNSEWKDNLEFPLKTGSNDPTEFELSGDTKYIELGLEGSTVDVLLAERQLRQICEDFFYEECYATRLPPPYDAYCAPSQGQVGKWSDEPFNFNPKRHLDPVTFAGKFNGAQDFWTDVNGAWISKVGYSSSSDAKLDVVLSENWECSNYVNCNMEVRYVKNNQGAIGYRTGYTFPMLEDTCEAIADILGPNRYAGNAIRTVEAQFTLAKNVLAKCETELEEEENSNIKGNTNWDMNVMKEKEQGILEFLVKAQDNEDSADTTEEELYIAQDTMSEYWEENKYCNALPDLISNIRDASDIQSNAGSGDMFKEEGYNILEHYIATNEDFQEMLQNRTWLVPSTDLASYQLARCELTISGRDDFSEDGESSMCKDLSGARYGMDSSTASDIYNYCTSCEDVNFFSVGDAATETKKRECFAFLLMQAHRYNSPSITRCFNSLAFSEDNRKTLTNKGVHTCSMDDTDCKDKIKRFIERNAAAIGIVLFVEVFAMYIILFVTQKAIILFKDEDEVEDDDED